MPMITKLFEVRDIGTFIPCMATCMKSDEYLVRRAGFSPDNDWVILVKLTSLDGRYDPNTWPDNRTMPIAHKYIQENWQKLKSGDVIDVAFILGETTEPKKSEREDQGSLWRGVYGGL